MQQLLTAFNNAIEDLYTQGVALPGLIVLGCAEAVTITQENPHAIAFVGAGDPNENPARLSRKQLKISELPDVFWGRPNLVLELLHGRAIRTWYDFLAKVFEQLIDSYFAGTLNSVPTDRLTIKFQLDRAAEPDLSVSVAAALKSSFLFSSTDDQVKTVSLGLNKVLPPNLLSAIRLHTMVRNCFEHSAGILRSSDLRRVGLDVLTLSGDDAQPRSFSVGDTVAVSIWDLEDICGTLNEAAAALIL